MYALDLLDSRCNRMDWFEFRRLTISIHQIFESALGFRILEVHPRLKLSVRGQHTQSIAGVVPHVLLMPNESCLFHFVDLNAELS